MSWERAASKLGTVAGKLGDLEGRSSTALRAEGKAEWGVVVNQQSVV